MSKLSLKRYSFLLSIQIILLINDLIINCIGVFFEDMKEKTFLYFLQDSSLLILVASLIYICYSTTVYQMGLSGIIFKNFGFPLIVLIVYILITLAFHIISVNYKNDSIWIATLYGVQKMSKTCVIRKLRQVLLRKRIYYTIWGRRGVLK